MCRQARLASELLSDSAGSFLLHGNATANMLKASKRCALDGNSFNLQTVFDLETRQLGTDG
jgi:hypothetical protein